MTQIIKVVILAQVMMKETHWKETEPPNKNIRLNVLSLSIKQRRSKAKGIKNQGAAQDINENHDKYISLLSETFRKSNRKLIEIHNIRCNI